MTQPFPFLLLPYAWAARNRMRRRERGDCASRHRVRRRSACSSSGALFYGAYWLTSQLSAYEEFGDYLLRLGLSWLFLTSSRSSLSVASSQRCRPSFSPTICAC